MKGGGVKRFEDVRYPAFLGALLDTMPKCIDMKDGNGEVTKGYYLEQFTEVIGA